MSEQELQDWAHAMVIELAALIADCEALTARLDAMLGRSEREEAIR